MPWIRYYLGYGNLVVAISSLAIGFFVISKDWRNPVKRAFFILSAMVGLYGIFFFLMMLSRDFERYLFWWRMMVLPVIFLGIAGMHFLFAWLGIAGKYRVFIAVSYIIGFLFEPILFTELYIYKPLDMGWGYAASSARPGLYLHILLYLIFFNTGFFTLIWYFPRLSKLQKRQAILFFIGMAFGAISGTPNFLSIGGITPRMPPATGPLIVVYVFIYAYAIIRYRAMEIDTVIHKTILWLMSILFLIMPMAALYQLAKYWLMELTPLITIAIISISLLIFLGYYHRLKPRIDHFFRRRAYDYQAILADLPSRVGTSLDLEVLSRNLFSELRELIYIRNGLLLVKPPDKETFEEASSVGYDNPALGLISKPKRVIFPADDPVVFWLSSNQKLVERAQVEVDPQYTVAKESLLSFFNDYALELLIPLTLNEQLISILGLGKKENLQAYRISDVALLEKLGRQIGISIDNALHHGDIVEKERLAEELRLGRQIQMMLLPQSAPLVPGLIIQGMMEPAKEIGGDYYDFITIPQRDSLSVVIGDVSGKGVAAGLLMAMAKTAIHTLSQEQSSPKQILLRANQILNQHIGGQKFMTMLYFTWQANTRTMTYSSAGHEHILIYRNRGRNLEAIQSGGMMLGMIPDIEMFLEDRQIQLDSKDKILLYTDGVTEALNQTQDRFGLVRLKDLFIKHNDKAADELMNIIKDEVYAFIGDVPQYDDITLVVMEAV